jgi:hypothetical protein
MSPKILYWLLISAVCIWYMVVIVCIYIVAFSALKFIIYDIFDALLKPWKPELINIAAEINRKSKNSRKSLKKAKASQNFENKKRLK